MSTPAPTVHTLAGLHWVMEGEEALAMCTRPEVAERIRKALAPTPSIQGDQVIDTDKKVGGENPGQVWIQFLRLGGINVFRSPEEVEEYASDRAPCLPYAPAAPIGGDAREAGLTWSKDLPTGPGFYWLGSPVGEYPSSPDIVSVEYEGDCLMVSRFGDDGDTYRIEENKGDLWAGPIPPPEGSNTPKGAE
jgi:hypothetical protein